MLFEHYFFKKITSYQKILKKRCILESEKDSKNHLETSHEEWNQILDLADKNYLKCMGIPYY